MFCLQKIELENSIFARAASLCVPVYARSGRLVCITKDPCLQVLLRVYNAFFYEENQVNFCACAESFFALMNFENRPARTPILSTKEYNFELVLGENYVTQN